MFVKQSVHKFSTRLCAKSEALQMPAVMLYARFDGKISCNCPRKTMAAARPGLPQGLAVAVLLLLSRSCCCCCCAAALLLLLLCCCSPGILGQYKVVWGNQDLCD
jgi:hypothetical protein